MRLRPPKVSNTVLFMLVAVAAYFVFIWPDHGQDHDELDEQPAPKSTTSAPASSGSEVTRMSDADVLRDRSNMFAWAYFSRNSRESAVEAEAEVADLVTDRFLNTAVFGYDPVSDARVIAEGSWWTVQDVTSYNGDVIGTNSVGSVTIQVQKNYPDGSSDQISEFEVTMTWEKQGPVWLLDEMSDAP